MKTLPFNYAYTSDRLERGAAVKAYDSMAAARPMVPPPLRRETHTISAARRSLIRDIRKGAYTP